MNPLDLQALRTALAATGERRLLLISGAPDWCRRQGEALVAAWGGAWAWAGATAPAGTLPLAARQPDAALGGEWDGALLDAWSGLRPDLLGAVGGAVRGGGLLVLLAPPLAQWSDWRDADYGRMATFPLTPADLGQRWWRRLRRLLDHPAVLVWSAADHSERPVRLPPAAPLSPWRIPAAALAGQAAAVAAVVRCANGRAQRPLVMVADRGRGKSATLGIAAAQLARAGRPVLATGPRPAACTALLRHAAAEGADGLRFIPFAELVQAAAERRLDPAALLLVDEAAGLPVAGLLQLAAHPRVVFASTVHGYEGNGRGFELRFLPRLAAVAPHWRRVGLTLPLRWAADDPLEAWLAAALLLDAEPSPLALAPASADSCDHVAALTPAALDDDALLRELFGLLVQAHYRTAPDDLRQLLDDPTLRLWVARSGGAVVGVLVVAAEGALPAALHDPILAGRRRPRGHLLPQSLAAHAGAGWTLARRWLRVVRIAVAPAWQRRGTGQRLLAALAQTAAAEGVDALGVSFAADAALLRFWRAAGFSLLRIGVRREAGSGGEALLLGRVPLQTDPAATSTQTDIAALAARLQRQLPLLLADRLRDWDVALVAAALQGAHSDCHMADLDAIDLAEARRFAAGAVALEHVLDAVARVARAALALGALPAAHPAPMPVALLVGRVLQLRPLETLVVAAGLEGRDAAERMLRAAVAELLPVVERAHQERRPTSMKFSQS